MSSDSKSYTQTWEKESPCTAYTIHENPHNESL